MNYPLRFVTARSIDLRDSRSHRPKVGGNLPAMVNDVEEKAPRHGRGGPLVAEELERAFPAGGGQSFPALGHCPALFLVRFEHFLHRRRHRQRCPFRFPAFERLNNHRLLADDLPRDFLCGT